MAWSLLAAKETYIRTLFTVFVSKARGRGLDTIIYIRHQDFQTVKYHYLSSYCLTLSYQISTNLKTMVKQLYQKVSFMCQKHSPFWGLKACCTKVLIFLFFLISLLSKFHLFSSYNTQRYTYISQGVPKTLNLRSTK